MYADSKFRPIPLEAVTLLNEGHLVQAIKVIRQVEGLGLKDAKDRRYKKPLIHVHLVSYSGPGVRPVRLS